MKHIRILGLTAVLATGAAAQEMVEHEAHVHGTSALDSAFEGGEVAMELRVPGADIVGFEHAAETDADKAALDEGIAALADPAALFAFSPEAGCRFTEAQVAWHDEETEDEDHDHDAHHDHAEFHADYSLTCDAPDALTEIAFPYFDRFERAQELEIQAISGKGSFGAEATRDAPKLDLKGRT